MAVVGTLTVDLVANTATFSGDLGKAAQSAEDFGNDAQEAGSKIDFSMREARGGIALAGEELGVHIPRHLQTLMAEIPGVGLAFAEMLPIVGVVAAIAIIEKLIIKASEAREKMELNAGKLAETTASVMGGLDDKLLEVEKKADELAGNHLGALYITLTQIDHATLKDLASEFTKLAASADASFGDMRRSWYEMRVGSEGAKNALDHFKQQYDTLIAQGKGKEASDLLKGTLDSANASLKALQTAGFVARGMGEASQKALDSQKALVDVLNAQVEVEGKLAALNMGEKQNAKTEEKQKAQKEADEAVKKAQKAKKAIAHAFEELDNGIIAGAAKANKAWAEGFEKQMGWAAKADEEAKKAGEEKQSEYDEVLRATEKAAEEEYKVASEKEKHLLAIHKQTLEQTAAAEVVADQKMVDEQVKALNKRIEELDKFAPNYEKKEKELQDKIKQIQEQGAAQQQQIQDQAQVKELSSLSQTENKMGDMIAQTAAKSILTGKNVAKNFEQVSAQMVEAALTHALEMETIDGRKRLSDAKTAAANVYKTVSDWPVVGPFLAPALAAGAFAGVMAFAGGGEVPGLGSGDTVPAMLTPGETVVTKALTDQVKGSRGGGGHHITYAPEIHAVDGDGVKRMLEKHSAAFDAHLTATLRKHNRG